MPNIKKAIFTGLICISLSGCATAPYAAGSAVSKPETIVYKTTIPKVRSTIAQACDEKQLFVEQQTDNMVLCSKEANMGAQLLFSYKHGTPVQVKAQFNIFDSSDGGIKIAGRAWFESQNAFGKTDKQYLDQGQAVQDVQSILNTVKARVEGGKK